MSDVPGAPRARELVAFSIVSCSVLAIAALPWLSRADRALADPAALGQVSGAADGRLLAWILAWNGHAAWTQPLHWFDANIFHPARNMLAGSESLLGLLPLSLPFTAFSANPVLVANVVAWLTYPLTAVAMYAYLRLARLPASASAVGAALFCFGPYRLPGDVRVLQLAAFFLPLTSIAVQTSRPGRRWWLPIVVLLALTSSIYMAAMSAVVLLVELAIVLRMRGVRAAAVLVAWLLPIVPLLVVAELPYLQQASTIAASSELLLRANLIAELMWHVILHAPPLVRAPLGLACVLGLVGMLAPLVRRARPDAAWWRSFALFAIGLLVAAGSTLHVGPFEIPLPVRFFAGTPLAALRAFPRFLLVANMGLCGWAASGAACVVGVLRGRSSTLPLAPLAAGALLLAAIVPGAMALRASPLSDVDFDVPREVDAILASSGGAVLEIPPPLPGQFLERSFLQSNFMLRSTRHWRPLINGHTGYTPWWYAALFAELARLPEVRSLEAITELTALEWIVVHEALLSPRDWQTWLDLPGKLPWLRVALDRDGVLLLHVERERRTRWADALALGARFRGYTALGTPLETLPLDSAWAKPEWSPGPPRRVLPGQRVTGVLRVRNVGSASWPALVRPDDSNEHLVVVDGAWSRASDGKPGPSTILRLPRDVLSLDRVYVPFDVPAPDEAGTWTLTFRVRQVGGASFGQSPAATATVEVGTG